MLLMNLANTAAETAAEFQMDPMNFVTNLKYMGTGMLGIFIVMGAIILSTFVLNRVLNKKDKDGEEADRTKRPVLRGTGLFVIFARWFTRSEHPVSSDSFFPRLSSLSRRWKQHCRCPLRCSRC